MDGENCHHWFGEDRGECQSLTQHRSSGGGGGGCVCVCVCVVCVEWGGGINFTKTEVSRPMYNINIQGHSQDK